MCSTVFSSRNATPISLLFEANPSIQIVRSGRYSISMIVALIYLLCLGRVPSLGSIISIVLCLEPRSLRVLGPLKTFPSTATHLLVVVFRDWSISWNHAIAGEAPVWEITNCSIRGNLAISKHLFVFAIRQNLVVRKSCSVSCPSLVTIKDRFTISKLLSNRMRYRSIENWKISYGITLLDFISLTCSKNLNWFSIRIWL